jgi:hypothetical protein
VSTAASHHPQNAPESRNIGDLQRAAGARREAAWRLTMSERLALLNNLCKQMSAIKGAAQAH